MTLDDWARKWNIPAPAMDDLRHQIGINAPDADVGGGMSETAVDQRVMIKASQAGHRFWRNNIGVAVDERGVPVRFGLANDSSKINKKLKSGDRIGITKIIVTPEMVGKLVGVFTSLEIKHQGWCYTGKGREAAQLAWIELIISLGGIASFISDENELHF